jgi:DNA-directed RNA polymerase subunit RPC12/RpoP
MHPNTPHPLDGVQTRHALCTHCGYVPGGAIIEQGAITCPECGKAIVFELKKPAISRTTRAVTATLNSIGLLATLVIAGIIAAQGRFLVALGFVATIALLFIASRVFIAWVRKH